MMQQVRGGVDDGGVDDAAGEGWSGWWVGWMMQQVRGGVDGGWGG